LKELIIKELRDRRKSSIAYWAGSFLLLWLFVLIFPSIQNSAKELQTAFESYPKEFLAAFDLQDFNFNTLEKYLGAEQFSFTWPILAITLALSRAGNYFAGEIEKGTIGVILALPISRAKIFFSKYFAGMIDLAIFMVVSILGVIPLALLYNIDFDLPRLLNMAVLGMFFGGAIFSVAVMVSCFASEKAKVYFPITGLLVAMYAMNIISNIKPNLDWLQYGSVFHYFNAQDVLGANDVSWMSYVVFGSAILISLGIGLSWFKRRDISV
jgi:ABC-2 type transport system permease protein